MKNLLIYISLVTLSACSRTAESGMNEFNVDKLDYKELIIGCWKKHQDTIATEKFTRDSIIHLTGGQFFPPMKFEIDGDTMVSGYGISKTKAELKFLDNNSFVLTSVDTLIKPNLTYRDTFYRVAKCR